MIRRSKPLAALLALVLVVAACTSDDDDASPTPEPDDGVSSDAGYEADIIRTEGGVPHITGDSIADVTFGQGWASAEDRSCDLMDQVIRIRGERASVFGAGEDDEHLESDIAWRTIGIFDRASAEFADASDGVRELITSFTAGWNGYLADAGVDGIEGWCSGEDWVRELEPAEVYAYARAIALRASSGAVADFLVGAEPPTATETDEGAGEDEAAAGAALSRAASGLEVASNGWAVGSDRSETGGGLLVGNPHFPWEGALRFWEVHLTVPGELDIYGVQLSGLPGIGIGFTEEFAWTHTVSSGNRFTGYLLDLVPGEPTTYRYGDEEREMESSEIEIEVVDDGGDTTTETRTIWRTHYGPVLNIDGLGWSETTAVTYRDANIDNDDFIEQYLAMNQAEDLDEFIAAHEDVTGVPLFNTIATSSDGRAWYADTSATPNLSDEAIDGWLQAREEDPIVSLADDQGFVLLDGSDPANEWVEAEGARDPGLVPFADMPVTERADVLFNANDSFWLSNPDVLLSGDYSPLHGEQEVPQSPRTRQNAHALGGDEAFTVESLRDLSLENEGGTARLLRAELVERCRSTPQVEVPADEENGIAGGTVDLTEACDVLDAWDDVYDLDRVGPHIWREWIGAVDADTIFATPFDPADPVGTPAGLAPAADGNDQALVTLGTAIQVLDAAGIPLDRPWGEIQYSDRGGERVPIHGGDDRDGTTNIVRDGGTDTLEELPDQGEDVSPNTSLREQGYPVAGGTSFIYTVGLSPDGPPEAYAFLTYSNTQDRDSDLFVEATRRFSEKDWRTVAFTTEQIEAAEISRQAVAG